MKKNVYQLQKLAKRIGHRSKGAMKKLLAKELPADKVVKPWKGATGINANVCRAVVVSCAHAQTQLKQDIAARRIGQPGLKDARRPEVKRREALRNLVLNAS